MKIRNGATMRISRCKRKMLRCFALALFFCSHAIFAEEELLGKHADWLIFSHKDPINDSLFYGAFVQGTLNGGDPRNAFGFACRRRLPGASLRVVWRISPLQILDMSSPRPSSGDDVALIYRLGQDEPETEDWTYAEDVGLYSFSSPVIKRLVTSADAYDRLALRSKGVTHVYSLDGAQEAFTELLDLCFIDVESIQPFTPDSSRSESPSQSGEDYIQEIRREFEEHMSYPKEARTRRLQGVAVVRLIINEDGSLMDIEIVESSGHPVIDNAALQTVRRASPLPRIPESMRVGRLELVLPISFSLR